MSQADVGCGGMRFAIHDSGQQIRCRTELPKPSGCQVEAQAGAGHSREQPHAARRLGQSNSYGRNEANDLILRLMDCCTVLAGGCKPASPTFAHKTRREEVQVPWNCWAQGLGPESGLRLPALGLGGRRLKSFSLDNAQPALPSRRSSQSWIVFVTARPPPSIPMRDPGDPFLDGIPCTETAVIIAT